MDINQNKDFYIKKNKDNNQREYNVFFVNNDAPLSDEILQEMAKYEIVRFCNIFNQPVGNLPTGIKILTFGSSFNQTVDNLPSGLQNLTFGDEFDQPVDNLPIGLKSLTLKRYFNQPVDFFTIWIAKSYFWK